MKFIEEVEHVFEISGRGCVIAPGIPYSFDPSIKIGDRIQFNNPSGSVVLTSLRGIEMLNRGKPMEHVPFSVEITVKTLDIEVGAKFYLVSSEE